MVTGTVALAYLFTYEVCMDSTANSRPATYRIGYRANFLTTIIGIPSASAPLAQDLVQLDGSPSSTTLTSPWR